MFATGAACGVIDICSLDVFLAIYIYICLCTCSISQCSGSVSFSGKYIQPFFFFWVFFLETIQSIGILHCPKWLDQQSFFKWGTLKLSTQISSQDKNSNSSTSPTIFANIRTPPNSGWNQPGPTDSLGTTSSPGLLRGFSRPLGKAMAEAGCWWLVSCCFNQSLGVSSSERTSGSWELRKKKKKAHENPTYPLLKSNIWLTWEKKQKNRMLKWMKMYFKCSYWKKDGKLFPIAIIVSCSKGKISGHVFLNIHQFQLHPKITLEGEAVVPAVVDLFSSPQQKSNQRASHHPGDGTTLGETNLKNEIKG